MEDELHFGFDAYEIGIVHGAVIERIKRLVTFCLDPEYVDFREEVPLDVVERTLHALTRVYFRMITLVDSIIAAASTGRRPDPDIDHGLHLAEELVDFVAGLSFAEAWDEIPFHDVIACPTRQCVWCETIGEATV